MSPQPDDLDGVWVSSSGGTKRVQKGCLNGSPIRLQGESLLLNGHTAVLICDDAVTWESNGNIVKWRRLKPETLDGAWRSSSGGTRTVTKGYFGKTPIKLQGDKLWLNGYTAVSISDERVTWKSDGNTVTWDRLWSEVRKLEGIWASSSGGFKTVVNAHLHDCPITWGDGKFIFKGYTGVVISDTGVTWEGHGHSVTWHRLQPKDLDGIWSSSSGDIKIVDKGHLDGSPITPADGKLALREHIAVAVSDTEVTWQGKGKMVKWRRLRPQDFDGVWSSSSGGTRTVHNGHMASSPIAVEGGKLMLGHYTASAISIDKVTWTLHGESVHWHRGQIERSTSSHAPSFQPKSRVSEPFNFDALQQSLPALDEETSSMASFHLQRMTRLPKCDNAMVLYHATRQSNALAICDTKTFLPGLKGFLGPGI